jgi:hypothetical protein
MHHRTKAGCGTRYLLINYLIGFHRKFGLHSPDTKIIALHLTLLLLQ